MAVTLTSGLVYISGVMFYFRQWPPGRLPIGCAQFKPTMAAEGVGGGGGRGRGRG